MSISFKKPRQNRIFQHIVEEIQKAVLEGRLKPGDQLPAEMKLKEMFNTSRGSIREALRVLEQKGLIEIKTGVTGGATVTTPDQSLVTESLNLLVQSRQVSLNHLLEFRQEVEGAVAALAAMRAKPADIQVLNQLLKQARSLLGRAEANGDKLLKIDIQLHIGIGKVSANPVFLSVLRMVHENILNSYDWLALKSSYALNSNFMDMEILVAAIESGQIDRARQLAQDHVRKCHRYGKTKRS
ncbi:MAG: FadR family transcriptional regulator [Desulfobacteraceae bacterium]|nr:FadR family transcriptional regulator [Desulfobacteraceae bacterium]